MAIDQDARDQEAVRAFRELSAYFKGRRTEREARAALKILKAFIRERERVDPAKRPPLPRRDGKPAPNVSARKKSPSKRVRQRPQRTGMAAEAVGKREPNVPTPSTEE
jgi:hypothetical protein